jgi:hypothetical protein
MVARAIALKPRLKLNTTEYELTRNFLAIILKIFLIASAIFSPEDRLSASNVPQDSGKR